MVNKDETIAGPDTVAGRWDFGYEYLVGETTKRFFHEIREHQRICGTRCDQCHRVMVPPRSFCDRCFVPVSAWQELGSTGRVETFTILTTALEGFPEPPVIIAYATLDGADTAIANFLTGVDITDVDAAGRALAANPPRVRTVYRSERDGSIRDFHFEVIA